MVYIFLFYSLVQFGSIFFSWRWSLCECFTETVCRYSSHRRESDGRVTLLIFHSAFLAAYSHIITYDIIIYYRSWPINTYTNETRRTLRRAGCTFTRNILLRSIVTQYCYIYIICTWVHRRAVRAAGRLPVYELHETHVLRPRRACNTVAGGDFHATRLLSGDDRPPTA